MLGNLANTLSGSEDTDITPWIYFYGANIPVDFISQYSNLIECNWVNQPG